MNNAIPMDVYSFMCDEMPHCQDVCDDNCTSCLGEDITIDMDDFSNYFGLTNEDTLCLAKHAKKVILNRRRLCL